jgi:phage anti-repressor protein
LKFKVQTDNLMEGILLYSFWEIEVMFNRWLQKIS